MKRKIFTLLVAFIALATFQTNAQVTVLDGRNGIGGTDVYWSPYYSSMPTTLTGALTLGSNGDFAYRASTRGGEFGNKADYFTITATTPGSGIKRYTIRAYNGKNTGKLLEYRNNAEWEFVQFDATGVINTAMLPAQGGYVSAPSSSAANNNDRQLLVRFADGHLDLMTYKNYRAAVTATPGSVAPVWLQERPMTARWAQKGDFVGFPDFIQIKDNTGKIFTVKGSNNQDINKFKVALVGSYTVPTPTATADVNGDPTDGVGALYNSTDIHLFSLISPEESSKLVTVGRDTNVFGVQGTASNLVFGDEFVLKPDLSNALPWSNTNGFTYSGADQRKTQSFAIWIDIDGSLTIYPQAAWTYVYGNTSTSSSASLVENKSIVYNNHSIDLSIAQANQYFKIGCVPSFSSRHVVGPTDYDNQTVYSPASSIFSFEDITAYNQIPQKRYFYLETNIMSTKSAGTPERLIVDVVTESPNGVPVKKLVLTEREKNRSDLSVTRPPYYETPYDSLNTSACWAVEEVYDTDLNPAIVHTGLLNDTAVLVGYKIINEDGDMIQYAPGADWMTNAPGGVAVVSGQAQFDQRYLYPAKDYNPAQTPVPAYIGAGAATPLDSNDDIPSWVWKTTSFKDAGQVTKFFLTNLAGAIYRTGTATNGTTYPAKDIQGWGITMDITNSIVFPGTLPTQTRNCYYSSWDSNEGGRATFYNTGRTYNYSDGCSGNINLATGANKAGGVIQRNIGFYPFDYMVNQLVPGTGYYYNTNNTFGLELTLAPIEVGAPENKNAAPHDSTRADGSYIWYNYAVDSLWNYLYKEGSYAITEALNYTDVMKIDGDGLAYMGMMSNTSKDTFHIELANLEVLKKLQGTDFKDENYKWFYIKKDGKYMSFDVTFPKRLPDTTAYGFVFKETLPQNACAFRFYQPLVADKTQEFWILETKVPNFYYTNNLNGAGFYNKDLSRGINGGYRNILDNGTPGDGEFGKTYYAILQTGSKTLGVTPNPNRATRWDFHPVKELNVCPVDYIDNDFLADTKMYGAPLVAERYKGGQINGDSLALTNGVMASEDRKNAVTFTLVPAARILPNGHIEGGYYSPGAVNAGKTTLGFATGATLDYQFGSETRPVQLYYVRRVVGTDTTYMTTDSVNVFAQDLPQNMTPSVNGGVIRFNTFKYIPALGGVENDSSLLQMFAIYGRLGLDPERATCISSEKDFHYGEFMFAPAAAYKYDYKTLKPVSLERNVNIGNSDFDDEFRLGAYYEPRNQSYPYDQLIVLPGKSQGIPASEYIFSYVPYNDKFACPNFVDDVNGKGVACNGRVVTNAHDYADPSVQWKVNSVSPYIYEFDVVAEQMRNQAKVAQTVLKDNYYLFLINETKTPYDGYQRNFIAVKKYERVNGKYNFGSFQDDIKMYTVTQITDKNPGDVTKVTGTSRIYNGDSAIDYFYKFSDEELTNFDWTILETTYQDRFVWAEAFRNALPNAKKAFIDSMVLPDYPAKFLSVIKNRVNVIADCEGTTIHEIPYYNIVYTDPTDNKQYYLELDQAGNATFVYLTDAERRLMADWTNNPDYKPGMKFCFPYRMKAYNSIEYVKEGADADPSTPNNATTNRYYDYGKLYIQSLAVFDAGNVQRVDPYLLKVSADSRTLAGQRIPNLYDVDYTKNLGAATWIFGDNGTATSEWIRLQGVPEETVGFLRNPLQPAGDDNFVVKTLDNVAAGDVNYATLSNKDDIKNRGGNIDVAKLRFVFVDSALLGKYAPKQIWYYYIINEEGKYLTSAGTKGTPSDPKYNWGGEGYAYFTDKFASDSKYQQLFGLKHIDPKISKTGDAYNFWVVAGVDPLKDNKVGSEYYYLAEMNHRLTFRYGGGTTQQATEDTAMEFQFGNVKDNTYTDIKDVDAAGVQIYGTEGAVVVNNVTGVVKLYTIDGRLVKSVEATGTKQTIAVTRGVYIVKVGNDVVKVVVQ